MSSVRLNVLANFAGQGWMSLLRLVLIPIYIHLLGIEAYGLIGFYLILQMALQVLDLGIGQTLNREMARYAAAPREAQEARDLTRTLEVGYWAVGIVIGCVLAWLAPVISTYWIKAETLAPRVVEHAVVLMGVLVALQWPLGLYHGGLLGLQRHVQFNAARIVVVTVTGVGSAAVLWLVAPTVTAFFTWQIIAAVLSVGIMMVLLWRSLPQAPRAPRFSPKLVARLWRFAAGVSGITVSGLVLAQLDKWILVSVLSLKTFGYYTLAGALANALYLFITPIFTALYPRFSSLVAARDTDTLGALYHMGSQLMAVMILPLATVLVVFSAEILLLWTGDADAARYAAAAASILVVGTALNGLMNLPFALQLAHGWTSLGLRINAVLIVLVVPSVYYGATRFGAVGAATVWAALNAIYLAVGIPLTHRRLLRGEGVNWLLDDVFPVVGIVLLVVLAGRYIIPDDVERAWRLAALAIISVCAFGSAVFAAPLVRHRVAVQWRSRAI